MSDERFAWMTSEREVSLHYLNAMRDAVVRVSEGLSEERQREPAWSPAPTCWDSSAI